MRTRQTKRTGPDPHLRPAKPVVPRTLVALIAICFVFAALHAALLTVVGIADVGGDDAMLRAEHGQVVSYLRGPVGAQNTLMFLHPDERAHMTDVKRLFEIAFMLDIAVFGVLVGTFVVFVRGKMWDRLDELLTRALRASGWSVLALCVVLGGAALLNFERFWLLFHAVLFPQGNWLFPIDGPLLTLYPPQFWTWAVTWWSVLVLLFGIVAVALSYVMERMRRHHELFTERFERQR